MRLLSFTRFHLLAASVVSGKPFSLPETGNLSLPYTHGNLSASSNTSSICDPRTAVSQSRRSLCEVAGNFINLVGQGVAELQRREQGKYGHAQLYKVYTKVDEDALSLDPDVFTRVYLIFRWFDPDTKTDRQVEFDSDVGFYRGNWPDAPLLVDWDKRQSDEKQPFAIGPIKGANPRIDLTTAFNKILDPGLPAEFKARIPDDGWETISMYRYTIRKHELEDEPVYVFPKLALIGAVSGKMAIIPEHAI